jgi:hypothetical protein
MGEVIEFTIVRRWWDMPGDEPPVYDLVPTGPGGLLLWTDIPPALRQRPSDLANNRYYDLERDREIIRERSQNAHRLCLAAVRGRQWCVTGDQSGNRYLQCGIPVLHPGRLCSHHQVLAVRARQHDWSAVESQTPLGLQCTFASEWIPSNSSDALEARLVAVLRSICEQLARREAVA